MTVKDVKKKIKEIQKNQLDYEIAHRLEDNLYKDVLLAIATGKTEDPAKIAAEALKTSEINFSRYCS